MITNAFYNIHSIIYINVRGDSRLIDDIDIHLHPFRCNKFYTPPNIIIDRYDNAPCTCRTTVVDDYDYGSGAYRREATRTRFNFIDYPHTYYMDRLGLPINLILQLALLKVGYTFMHGAGLCIDGRSVLFLAYPGTGKTTLASTFVRAGATLYGDDLCIVGNGNIFAYPQALSIYPHHLTVLGYSNSKIKMTFSISALVNRLRSLVKKSNTRFAKYLALFLSIACTESVNISPDVVFGKQAIGTEGKLDYVVVLERSGEIYQLFQDKIDLSQLTDQASTILWHEWHNSFHDLLLYDAMAQSGRATVERMRQVSDIAYKSIKNIPYFRVRIPANWDNAKLVKEFPAFMQKIIK